MTQTKSLTGLLLVITVRNNSGRAASMFVAGIAFAFWLVRVWYIGSPRPTGASCAGAAFSLTGLSHRR